MSWKSLSPYTHIGPDGVPLTPSDLPPTNTTRWVIRRKAVVVGAVESGMISLDDACLRYSLSVEELTAWRQALKEFGPAGLKTTKTHQYAKVRTPRK
jgi:hypothetical protein